MMELTEEILLKVLEELIPYIEANGGYLQLYEIEYETGYVKVKLGGACETCAMSTITLKQGIEKKLMMEIPDVCRSCSSIIMEIDSQIRLGHLLLSDRTCRVCGETKNLIDGFYLIRKDRGTLASAYSYECKSMYYQKNC